MSMTQAQLDALAAEITNDVNTQVPGGELFGGPGYPLTFLVGDETVAEPGSFTDHDGNTWTIYQTAPFGDAGDGTKWWAGMKLNGQSLWDGYNIAIRPVNGDVWVEEAKFSGWWDLTQWQESGESNIVRGPDPGHGDGSGSTPTPTPTPAPTGGSASPDGTFITPGNGSFTDAAGNTYAIDAAGNADENAAAIPGGSGTAQMAFEGGSVYGQDKSSGAWYTWDQSRWTPAASPPSSGGGGGTPPPTPPSSGGGGTPPPTTTLTDLITPGQGSFSDASGNVYSIDLATNAKENGSPIPGGHGTKGMDYVGGVVYGQDQSTGNWYTWDQSAWTPV